eukprot:4461383-Amphidinium_carterae.2
MPDGNGTKPSYVPKRPRTEFSVPGAAGASFRRLDGGEATIRLSSGSEDGAGEQSGEVGDR